ncbi:Ycf49-like protein [Sesamum angolense]|uniref:Ycf49-like protein n=1 Tax=Sesamum angolense TaxID=2727404 RepID=A0AAE1WW64_9LAMI|nr:Ycf49-like protein [Sesamum angolense]
MGISSLCFPPSIFLQKPGQDHIFTATSSSTLHISAAKRGELTVKGPVLTRFRESSNAMTILMGAAGIALISLAGPAHAAESPVLSEPSNALSLPTWAIHISSVSEWVTAMALVWQYGEKSGYESWKGLSWGMVPLLGGALCACTWHFFYNSESLEKKEVERENATDHLSLLDFPVANQRSDVIRLFVSSRLWLHSGASSYEAAIPVSTSQDMISEMYQHVWMINLKWFFAVPVCMQLVTEIAHTLGKKTCILLELSPGGFLSLKKGSILLPHVPTPMVDLPVDAMEHYNL